MPKFIGEDDQTIQMQGDDGSPVSIAKSALSPEQLALYSGLGSQPQTDYAAMGTAPVSSATPQLVPQAPVAPTNVMPPVESGVKSQISPAMKPGDIATPTTPDSALPTGAMDKGLALESRGIAKEAQAGMAQGARDAGVLAGQAAVLEQNQKERQAVEAEKQKFVSSSMDEFKKSADEIASNKVQDFWADKSTGAKIAAAIAVGLGAISASRTGGPNHAAQIVNDAINRDLQRQQLDIANKKEGLAAKKSLFEMNLQKYGSRDAALAASASQYIQIAQTQLAKSAATYKGAEAGANFDKYNGALDKFKSEYDLKLAEALGKKHEEQVKLFVPEFNQKASTPEEATKIKLLVAKRNSLLNGIDEAIRNRKDSFGGARLFDRDAIGKGEALMGGLQTQLNDLQGLSNRFAGGAFDIIKKQIPSDLYQVGSTVPKLEQAKENIKRQIDAELKSSGFDASKLDVKKEEKDQ